MIPYFYILGSKTERPVSCRTIFTDGAPDATFRPDIDMELSHWIPNTTPDVYKADTSTEICMKFISQNDTDGWDLAINNHVDVDGILAVFTLIHSEKAMMHRDTIIQAAEMGDFSGWGDRAAQILYQGLTVLMDDLKAEKMDTQHVYETCFKRALSLLEGRVDDARVAQGMEALKRSSERVESGSIIRRELHNRFAHYHIPFVFVGTSLAKTLKVPAFNEEIKDDMWLHPQVRNRLDKEKVQLVSAEAEQGWYYDVWYPGYMWADTPHSWRAPGFTFSGSTNGYMYGYEPLETAVRTLQELETANGTWTLAHKLSPFSSINGRNFPIVLSFLSENSQPAASDLPPERVVPILASAFE
ncbi:hypothetical protein AM501_02775 [Aneurinibacillus migulanus]|uniref:Uncharacterized protein n=1 Tax=Aneurinibacillus migulanus TaxID=47500 RepID=A0A0D1WEC1_ANEMI|nr:DUF6687 family protein [Aneurinibacillus migulanus]KIV56895.1 hypothetical protein TS64_09060 [Aneurinibacillus migulanus]KIV57249.1 hypothetical protein TS65_10800 [Aneurinibacillus migulanus]KON96857.1 hypothetical protein AF333_16585 [Aneurinibacillus migulanus]KPD09716.1 hypothetical protein AM501_02775 [Aneurinibacillus migulanus]MCP1358654.1 hypothetical protein [Aneurinibacillus migulanus]